MSSEVGIIGLYDNFFEIGGHSSAAATLVGDLINFKPQNHIQICIHTRQLLLRFDIFTLLDEANMKARPEKHQKTT